MHVIQTENLTKRFGKTVAVDGVTIHVRKGEIYGFLGLNGAGKTTTIRLLLSMIRPDSGSVTLFGKRVKQASNIWNEIGYLVEAPYAYPDITVWENLSIIYHLRGLQNKHSIDAIIDRLHLTRYRDIPVKNLSTGNKQRLGLAKALIHHPKLLILDEPINGLDPAGIVEIRAYLEDLAENQQTTVFLSSHILSEIARLATRIGIIHEGKLIREINSDLLERQIIKKLRVHTSNNRRALIYLSERGYEFTEGPDGIIETTAMKAILKPEDIATLLVQAQLPPKLLDIFEEDLEAYFLRIIGAQ